jgi:hypothetical protein
VTTLFRRLAIVALAGLFIPVASAAIFYSTFQPTPGSPSEPTDKGCVGNVSAGYACVAATNTFSIDAWLVTSGSVDYQTLPYQPAAVGGASVDLNHFAQGQIQHQLTGMTVGGVYAVTLMYSGNPDGNISAPTPNPKTFTASVTSTGGGSTWGSQSFSFNSMTATEPNMNYSTGSFLFTAGATTGSIWLTGTSGGFYGAVVGSVDVSDAGVPEPATFTMLGAGLLALAVVRRRR